jgi:type II secretory pathway component PulF
MHESSLIDTLLTPSVLLPFLFLVVFIFLVLVALTVAQAYEEDAKKNK